MSEVRISRPVVLWGGPHDGQELELSALVPSVETVTLDPPQEFDQVMSTQGHRYVRTNRIKGQRWVYRYDGRGERATP